MTQVAQNLARQIQEQTLKSAEDFYGNSLGSLKSQLQDSRSQLQELIDQLPESQQDTREQLEEMVSSYEDQRGAPDDESFARESFDGAESGVGRPRRTV